MEMLVPILAPASVMSCKQERLKGSCTCETVLAGKKPDSTHPYRCAFKRKAWLWPSAKTRLAKARQFTISAYTQIIVFIKNYGLSCFTQLVIIQSLACSEDSTFPNEGKEGREHGTKGFCRISGELTHKITVSSLAPNKSSFETHETLSLLLHHLFCPAKISY